MTTQKQAHQLADLLLEIEAEMRRVGLWDESPPTAEALASTMPFCYDTLSFPQWIQWILLVRLKQLLEQGALLPGGSDIQPLAEYSFEKLPQDTRHLIDLIGQLDQLLNQG